MVYAFEMFLSRNLQEKSTALKYCHNITCSSIIERWSDDCPYMKEHKQAYYLLLKGCL